MLQYGYMDYIKLYQTWLSTTREISGLSLVYSFFVLSEEDGYTFYSIFPYPPYPIPEERKGYICICPYIFKDLSFVQKDKFLKSCVGHVCLWNNDLWLCIRAVQNLSFVGKVVMKEKYARCNLRRLQDDFPSLKERIALRLVSPMEDSYFTNLLKVI